jgi:hypothetical protein
MGWTGIERLKLVGEGPLRSLEVLVVYSALNGRSRWLTLSMFGDTSGGRSLEASLPTTT